MTHAPDPLDCETFATHLLAHMDGELDEALSTATAAHEAGCADCADRVRAEQQFEARLGVALVADADAGTVVAALDRAARDTSPPAAAPTGRVLRPLAWLRRAAVAAAALFVVTQAAWFFCIPPFECSYLQAVEGAVDAADVAPPCDDCPESALLAGLVPPARLAEFELVDGPVVAPLALRDVPEAVRVRYRCGGDEITAVWSDPDGHEPSFRRRVERDGTTWWIAEEHGRVIVAWMCPKTRTLCSLIGSLSEERLLAVADAVRDQAH